MVKKKEKRRRYLLNTNVPLAAYYGSPGAVQWLARHGEESYYSSLLRMELRRLKARGAIPSVAAVLNVLGGYGVDELRVDARRLLRRAKELSDQGFFPRTLVFDAAHVLAAREHRLVIVSYDDDIRRLAEILGVPYKRPRGRPYGPQDQRPSGREGGERGTESKG